MLNFLVIDNGSHSIKLAHNNSTEVQVVPNCVARSKDDRRLFIGQQLDEKTLLATLQYRRPHEKGYLTGWETEKAIWDGFLRTGNKELVKQDKTCLILTEPPHNPPTIQTNTDEIVFEEYNFDSYIRCTPAALISWGTLPLFRRDGSASCHEVVLVIDSGFSFTHITPVINGVPDHAHTKRLDIGGKFLTNFLKETVSFRQYNMMEETHLINQVKEQCCFVSTDFTGDMDRVAKGQLVKNYVLPDFATNTPGYLAEEGTPLDKDMQVLSLKYELFQIPELLLRPSDVGMRQGGIAEGVMAAINGLSDVIKSLCLENIVLIGGNAKFPGFQDRVTAEIRALAPEDEVVRVWTPPDPVTYVAECAVRMASHEEHMSRTKITRSQYLESGRKATIKFNQAVVADDMRQSHSPQVEAGSSRRRESRYDETSDRSDTPRSFSPDTEPEDKMEVEVHADGTGTTG